MEYFVVSTTPGIATEELLNLFNKPSGETIFVSFASLGDTDSSRIPAATTARIVFHGEHNPKLVQRIHTTHPTSKYILLFNTAEGALLQDILKMDELFSVDDRIDNWSNSIRQLSLLAEQNPDSSVLIEFANLVSCSEQITALVNKHLGVQLNNYPINTADHSGIARLIAATALINRDDAMALYDDAKTLALTSQYDSSYTDASCLIARQQTAALNEFKALQKFLGNNSTENIALAIETQQCELEIALVKIQQLQEELEASQINITNLQQDVNNLTKIRQQLNNKESELEIALLQINQLQEELEASQINITNLQQDVNNLTKIRQQLNSKESELEIALLQINQLQEELENTLDKYGLFERPLANTAILEKILGEVPLLGLLRNQANIPI